jgi:hypothetical protein
VAACVTGDSINATSVVALFYCSLAEVRHHCVSDCHWCSGAAALVAAIAIASSAPVLASAAD